MPVQSGIYLVTGTIFFPGKHPELENEIARALTLAPDQGSITPDLFSDTIRFVTDIPPAINKDGSCGNRSDGKISGTKGPGRV